MDRNNRTLRLYFATWNVATKYPDGDPYEMLGIHENGSDNLPDFFIVGLQEVKAQPQNMVMDIFFEDPWTKCFREILKKKDYIKIRTQKLQGLVLNIFCLRKHLTHLREIEARYTKTGLGGMWGNKGAVSVRLNIYGVSICIINTHLTPHDHLLADRISDYNTILRDHVFNVAETRNILYHEDQLRMVIENGEAFGELTEAEITFPPTYKFEFASQNYDLKRRPSWTDRILYKVNADVYEDVKLKATQRSYKSHPNYVLSDHKPVTAEFDITIRPEFEVCGVEFQFVTQWFVNEENSVSYKLAGDARSTSGDWIGLFHEGFSSLDDYLVYEYVGHGKTNIGVQSTVEPHAITERIFFSDTALRAPGMYRLVYVAQRGDGITGILGMSPPFPGHRRLNERASEATSVN
ncbi:inositol polyphosphate 5-phosphatase K-like isoform X2 [Venturia canescens]|uniref:inositol polyphosphate 5-phosphatase K-like isoform X2 n=1 Tax=Venturia canescens TaxID=32260 RepID=UPI001C9C4ACF|nr:inositol polyphosphate 5-phosphatase K-like isoform X2 [Venturia canescens]